MIITITKGYEKYSTIDLTSHIEGIQDGFLSFLIGRSQDCHIQLDDKMISREHAKLTYENDNWKIDQLSDLGNITINGEDKREYNLLNGDIFLVGPYSIKCEFTQNIVSNHEELKKVDNALSIDEEKEKEKEKEGSDDIEENSFDDEKFELGEVNDGLDKEGDSFSESENIEGNDVIAESFSESEIETEIGPEAEYDNSGTTNAGFEMEEFDNNSGTGTIVASGFSTFELDIFGEFSPYDKYLLETDEVFIGRDSEKCQIVLRDPEVSSVHAVLKRNKANCSLEDLDSGNGTLLEGKRVNKVNLENHDEFIIGSTTFTMRISSKILGLEEGRLMPVEENQFVEVEEIVEVGADFEVTSEVDTNASKSLFTKEALQDPEKRKKLLIGAVILLGVWTLFDEEEVKTDKKVAIKKAKVLTNEEKAKAKRTPEEEEFLSSTYELARELHNSGRYAEAMTEMERILPIDRNYKELYQTYQLSKLGLKRIEELEQLRQKEIDRKIRVKKIATLVKKAREATKNRSVDLAEAIFQQIVSIDPENTDITLMRHELDSWKKEQERIALEKAQKKAERARQVRLLAPGKNYFLKGEWHKAILKLQSYLSLEDIDNDLMKEATNMFNGSKENLEKRVNPLLGKARSLREGQDLKGAYEVYKKIIEFHPSHRETLVEMDDIRERLYIRSKNAYRRAIISESLDLFEDAKEKFQEVQQISPSDSEYYEKATGKLKEYID